MESPCIDVCTMDPVVKLCRGCGRTLEEIAGWSAMPPEQRRRIMALLPQRMREAGLAVDGTAMAAGVDLS